jgi:hypothetical protein
VKTTQILLWQKYLAATFTSGQQALILQLHTAITLQDAPKGQILLVGAVVEALRIQQVAHWSWFQKKIALSHICPWRGRLFT